MKYSQSEIEGMGLRPNAIPRHVALIMDGNGRWAKKRGLPRAAGHRAGTNRLREIIRFSSDVGMRSLTLYAFSTENRKRPEEEINVLCRLLVEYFRKEIDELHQNNVCIRALGELSYFPSEVVAAVEVAVERTRGNTGLILNIALNYGSRAEIIGAMQAAARAAGAEGREPSAADFETALYTAGQPDPDLVIRTSGEQRLSNFLLYQSAYSELYFTPVYWPDFTRGEYIKALIDYQSHERRYGGL